MDDILQAASMQEECQSGTEALLSELGRLRYRASAKKVQICKQNVTYLSYSWKRNSTG